MDCVLPKHEKVVTEMAVELRSLDSQSPALTTECTCSLNIKKS